MIPRPAPGEFAPFYAPYIEALQGDDALELLTQGRRQMLDLVAGVPPERETFRYTPEKWSVREVLGHIVDAERVFAIRALTFSRDDAGPLPGFDEDHWAAASNAGSRPLSDLAAEFDALRLSNLAMVRGLPGEALLRTGVASGQRVSVRALLWIMAGHADHHRRILRERYLTA